MPTKGPEAGGIPPCGSWDRDDVETVQTDGMGVTLLALWCDKMDLQTTLLRDTKAMPTAVPGSFAPGDVGR